MNIWAGILIDLMVTMECMEHGIQKLKKLLSKLVSGHDKLLSNHRFSLVWSFCQYGTMG